MEAILSAFDRLLTVFIDPERYPAANHFLERDASGFVFLLVDVNARPGATLQLFTSFGGHNYQAIL